MDFLEHPKYLPKMKKQSKGNFAPYDPFHIYACITSLLDSLSCFHFVRVSISLVKRWNMNRSLPWVWIVKDSKGQRNFNSWIDLYFCFIYLSNMIRSHTLSNFLIITIFSLTPLFSINGRLFICIFLRFQVSTPISSNFGIR